MQADTRKRLILAVLLLVMAGMWFRVWQQQPATGAPQAANATTPERADRTRAPEPAVVVDLAALDVERPAPAATRRNPFQFGAFEQPADQAGNLEPPPAFVAAPAPSVPAPGGPSLTLIGIVQPVGDSPRVAVLSDERGVYHGVEGAIIEGRLRIVSIGAESVELSNLDGGEQFVLQLPPS
ncbi:MAG: hypothetical protein AB7F99_18555 [Vicinamibacterales bacterium]